MTITVEDMVRREVHYCVSYLVSTLGQNCAAIEHSEAASDMETLAYQAMELCFPLDDWEEAAIQAGWELWSDNNWHRKALGDEHANETTNNGRYFKCNSAQEAAELDCLDPYAREVYEHWIVSDWLADQLIAQGEKVDKDFAGMTVWARTTTGQAIALDGVIQSIHAALVGER